MNGSIKTVSVIVPVYNVEKYLIRCIDSIINQTYKNLEIILVDDGSPDNCPTLCDNFALNDERINVIHQKNNGVSSARNRGSANANGDYIIFIDSDDWLEKEAISTMVHLIQKEQVDCVRMMFFINTDTLQIQKHLSITEGRYSNYEVRKLLRTFISCQEDCSPPLLLIDRRALSTVKPFNEEIHMLEDACFYVDLLSHIDTIYLSDTPTYHYFANCESACRSPRYYTRNLNDVLIVNIVMTQTLAKEQLLEPKLKALMDMNHSNIVSNYLFLMYKNKISNKVIIDTLHELNKNKKYLSIIESADISRLPFHLSYTIKCIKNNKPYRLIMFFKIRLVASQLKNIRGYQP